MSTQTNTNFYNKFLQSPFNVMDIQPIEPKKYNTYYLGVFRKDKDVATKEKEYTEVVKAVSGSAIEDYYPLIVNSLNNRGNWKCLNTDDAQNIHHVDFTFTNASIISKKANINYRLLLDSKDHYISNKTAFYDKFKDHDFILDFESINKNNIMQKKQTLFNKFNGKAVIVKPDKGSVGSGIIALNMYDFDTIKNHIVNDTYDDWTVSEFFVPALHDGYFVSNRIYFLVIKLNNNEVKTFFYKDFMNYKAHSEYKGDATDCLQMMTNFIDRTIPDGDEQFVKTRYVPHTEWLSNFSFIQQLQIYGKLSSIFSIISNQMKNDILCYNDYKVEKEHDSASLSKNKTVGFHIYGADALINNKGDVKIIEINGAPAINVKTRHYGLTNRLDYFDLMEEVVQKTIDTVYEPSITQTPLNNFIETFDGEINTADYVAKYYIAQSITKKYPFILEALKNRPWLKRTKTMHDNIDFFYGLRERYVTNDTNMNHYDELLNYLTSKRMKKAAVINKIQGITYFLASKDGIYKKLQAKYGCVDFHPESFMIQYDIQDSMNDIIKKETNKYPNISKWILKPVHGSRGLGIKIFDKTDYFFSHNFRKAVIEYITYYSENGFEIQNTNFDINFNGKANQFIQNVNQTQKYKYWILSRYIEKPDLLPLSFGNQIYGRKYNIRFYVLITINQKLPTFQNIHTLQNGSDIINIYLYTDFMLYFSMLDYYSNEIPAEYQNLDQKLLTDMRSLTNLETITKVSNILGYNDQIKIKKQKELTRMLSHVYPKFTRKYHTVKKQAINIVTKTINAVKYDLRPLNRFSDNYKGCYNLLAYDSMLDEHDKLWLIEINRGPDIVGLTYNIGTDGCKNMFDEIFKLTIDKHYGDNKNSNIKLFEKIDTDYQVIKN